jgi:hypothetical protein
MGIDLDNIYSLARRYGRRISKRPDDRFDIIGSRTFLEERGLTAKAAIAAHGALSSVTHIRQQSMTSGPTVMIRSVMLRPRLGVRKRARICGQQWASDATGQCFGCWRALERRPRRERERYGHPD